MKLRGLLTLGSASFLAISSLFSQVLGFARDKLLSYIYGAGSALDAYYASFRIPEFMYLSVGSFVSSAILVPLFAKKLRDDDAKVWFQKLFTTFTIFFIVVYGIIVLFLPTIVNKVYAHSQTDFKHSVVIYGSILLISTFFLSLSSIISSVAQERRDFVRVGLAPIFYNLGTVLGIVLLRPMWGIVGVCTGVVAGSIMHLLIQMPQVKKLGLFSGYGQFLVKAFSLNLLISTLKKSSLRTLSLAASAIVFFLLTYFASLYPAGSITIVAIAFSLQTVFHTLVGVSYGTVILPLLSDAFVKADENQFNFILKRGFKKIFLISFVLTGLVFIFKHEIVYVLFGGGKFNTTSVDFTAIVLGLFILSLYAQNAILMLSRAAYARADYILPLMVNILSAVLTYIFCLLFKKHFNSVITIPIAYSLSQYIALYFGLLMYRRKKSKEKYISFLYMLKVLFVIAVTTFSCLSLLNFILIDRTSIFTHIVFSFIVFGFALVSTYVLLGMIKDQAVKEDRKQFKDTVIRFLLALFPKRG